MTKVELRTFVKQMLGNQTSTTIDDAWYDDRVMEGYRRLVTFQGRVDGPAARKPKFRVLKFHEITDRLTRTIDETFTTNFIANQSGVLMVTDIYDRTNNRGIDRASDHDILTRDPDEQGDPRLWRNTSVGGSNGYYIWPYPGIAANAIDVYEYVVEDVSLATDSTEPVIPEEWHPAIGYAGAAGGARLLDMPERQMEMESAFKQEIAERLSPGEKQQQGGQAGMRRNIRVGSW